MELFFRLASPLTLANFIADIDQIIDSTEPDVVALRELCVADLVSIVGDAEAIEMIEAAGYYKTCLADLQSRCDAAAIVPLDCCAVVVEVVAQ